MAYQVVEEDAPPWTLAAEVAEGCSPVGILRTAAEVQAGAADDPSVVQG